jgi:L-amino acid N-acyltransferase YncA
MVTTAEAFLTRDGVTLSLRQIEAGDRDALQATVRNLSEESRYRRFLGLVKELSAAELTRLTEVDHRDHEALVAIAADGELVGVARYIRLDARPAVAEVAVTVADHWQGRGIGTVLLTRLIVRAEGVGVETFVASCLARNEDMLALFRELGRSVRKTAGDGGVVELEIELPIDEPHRVVPALRAVAKSPTLTAARPIGGGG